MFFIPEDCNNKYIKEIAIKLLQHIISTKQFITYGQLSLKMSFDISPRIIERPLGRISYACTNNGLPPISAMVVNQETQMPGKGFFDAYFSEINGEDGWCFSSIWKYKVENDRRKIWILIQFI